MFAIDHDEPISRHWPVAQSGLAGLYPNTTFVIYGTTLVVPPNVVGIWSRGYQLGYLTDHAPAHIQLQNSCGILICGCPWPPSHLPPCLSTALV